MKLKLLYWKLESIIYEIYARFLLFPGLLPSKKHSLPNKLIVSLTSYPPRFSKLHLTIKSLLAQSVKPNKVILWIAQGDKNCIPRVLKRFEKKYNWFDIKFCDDLRSYKKIVPVLTEYPDAFIVTADDDIFYTRSWLKKLSTSWKGDKKKIVAHRAHRVVFNHDGSLAPYSTWSQNFSDEDNSAIAFPTSGAGVLYPPHCLHIDTTKQELFTELCPNADDVWLFWMVRLNRCCIQVLNGSFNLVTWSGTDDNGLAQENVANNGNDQQIERLQKHYGTIQEISK